MYQKYRKTTNYRRKYPGSFSQNDTKNLEKTGSKSLHFIPDLQVFSAGCNVRVFEGF